MLKISYPIIVFYDGACQMCIAQIAKFKKADSKKHIVFTDISKPDFDQEQAGLTGESIQRYIYAKDSRGHLARGVDAFAWIWEATDKKFLVRLVSLPFIKHIAKIIYSLISRLRYLFGRKNNICDFHCYKEL